MEGKEQGIVGLSDMEKSAIGEICDLMTVSLTRAFGEKLDSGTGVSPTVEIVELSEIASVTSIPALLVQIDCALGLEGQFLLFIDGEGVSKVLEIVVPDDDKETEADYEVILGDLREMVDNAISEAIINFADSMGHSVDCSVIDTVILQDESGFKDMDILCPEGKLLHVSAELRLPDDVVKVGYLLPVGLGGQIIELLLNERSAIEGDNLEDTVGGSSETEQGDQEVPLKPGEEAYAFGIEQAPRTRDLQSEEFDPLDEGGDEGGPSNISLLLDVALDAAVELGRTQMTIAEILKLGRGSVIELDKLASEPVEFLANGTVIARGEVVVIDDNFGIRITEILSPKERLEHI
ncbi:MAG: flagellar motor switch protein FliN [Actinobacteria bacterium]|nr:flagellar motor switch protein FliN [Actinomycetota bacterium]